jgi:uncharacterized membrane protein
MTFLIFLFLAVLKGFSTVTVKLSQKNYVNGVNDSILFTAMASFFQILFMFALPPYYTYHFEMKDIAYPLMFSLFYILFFVLTFRSLKEGPTSLTAILQNFNMFVPIIAGIFIWNETTGVFQIIGIILFVVSLFLFNRVTYRTDNVDRKITLKWMLVTLLSTFFSGCAITISKQYTLINESSPKEFLIIFNFVILLFCLIYFIVLGSAGIYRPVFHKKFILYAVITGLISDVVNIIYMLYVGRFSSAFFFPLMNTSGIISVTLMTGIILKERISKTAYIGIAICAAALILLSI